MGGDKPDGRKLTGIFRSVSDMELQNKEVAALMGEVDEDSPNVLPGGLISKLGLTDAKLFHAKAKKRDKDFRDWLFREAVQRSLERINGIIDDLQKRIEELLEHMAKAEEELAELDERHETLEAELEYFQEIGLFDCDENGRLKNPEAEAIVSDWERKTEQKIDRTDPASYGSMLQILMDIEQRRIALRGGMKRDAAEYEQRKQQLDEAIQIREDLQGEGRELNRKGLFDFMGFVNGYNSEFEITGQSEIEENPVTDLLFEESTDELPEDLDTSLSFGFPPIQENFAKAVMDDIAPPEENRTNPSSGNRPAQMAKPTN